LSDDFGNPDWALPDTSLPPGGYLLVWADEDPADGRWHTNFALSGDGDEVVLTRVTGSGSAIVDSVSFGAQRPDTSFARQPDGGAWSLDPTPTPQAANN
jgi:hypothetical protein